MPRTILFAITLIAGACASRPTVRPADQLSEQPNQAPTTAPASRVAALPDDAPCDLSTRLVPGVPGSPDHLIKSSRNPNGVSELASLMRVFVDDLYEARRSLEAGQPVRKLHAVHRRMRCSWPSSPEQRDQGFDQRAQVYLGIVQTFDAQPSQATYNAIIASCISCHAQSCGGPLEFIGGMTWQ
jgi:hypothetical protein